MTCSDAFRAALVAELKDGKSGIFGTHPSTDEALRAAIALLTRESPAAVTTAIMSYHNTLLQNLADSIEKGETP